MKTYHYLYPGFFLCLLLLLNACKNGEEGNKAYIRPPVPALDPAFTKFELTAEKGDTFRLPSGTSIIFPPNVLLDAQGKAVKGGVEVSYREFHDAADIFLSGIPMAYDSAGPRQLQTAGMWELKASQNGQALFLDSTKSVSVRMASFQSGDDYNFYRLDTMARNWLYRGHSKAEINTQKVKLLEAMRKKTLPFPFDRKYFVFDYMALLDVEFMDKTGDYSWEAYEKAVQNEKNRKLKEKFASYNVSWSKIYLHSRLTATYKKVEYPVSMMVWTIISGGELPNWTKGAAFSPVYPNAQSGASFTPVGKNQYQVVLFDGKKKYKALLEAVMPIKALLAYPAAHWKNNYEKTMAAVDEQLKQEEMRLAQVADVFRTFEVNQLGIYNYDRLLKQEGVLTVKADFNFNAGENIMSAVDEVYLFPSDNRSVIKFPRSQWQKFTIAPDPGARLLAVLPGGQLSLYSAQQFARINFDSLRQAKEATQLFKMSSQSAASAAELKKLLSM